MKKALLLVMSILTVMISLVIVTNTQSVKIVKAAGESTLRKGVDTDYLLSLQEGKCIKLTDGDQGCNYPLLSLGIKVELEEDVQEELAASYFIEFETIDYNYSYDSEDVLLNLNENRHVCEDAKLVKEDGVIKLVPEVLSNKVDITKLREGVLSHLEENTFVVDLREYYVEPDEDLLTQEDLLDEYNKYDKFHIKYSNGYVLTAKDFVSYLDVADNQIIINQAMVEDSLESYIEDLLHANIENYNTVGQAWAFTKNNGEVIEVDGGTWGDELSLQKEVQYVKDCLLNFKSEDNRVPVLIKDYPDELPNTYVEVSIDEQHVWLYKDGVLVADSNIVTGWEGRHDTPKGVYYIMQKIDGTRLTGPTWNVWVDKWMKFTNKGHGFHDASWRKSKEFNPETYLKDGSHGCINLPKDFAYTLYDIISENDCVIIY